MLDRVELSQKHEFYADYCRPFDKGRVVGGYTRADTGQVTLGVHRALADREFGRAHKRRMRLLLPHFTQAINMVTNLELIGQERRAAFAALDTAIAVVPASGKVVLANRAAEAIFRSSPALAHLGLCNG
jgi:PAS domain-containing protein